MKIESIIRREGGTQVDLDGESYHFKADDAGRHVADVVNSDHVARFLAIPEGYRVIMSAEDEAAAKRAEDERRKAAERKATEEAAQAEAERVAAAQAEAERKAAEAEAERVAAEAEAAKAKGKKGK